MRESKLHKPFNKKGGWYFYFRRRDGVVCKCGPEPTEKDSQRIIDSREKCENCDAFAYFDTKLRVKPVPGPDTGFLCVECSGEFVDWHKKRLGEPPPELPRVQ